MTPVAVVPAAGRSARFGSQKLLARVGGDILLNRTLASLLEGGVGRIIVVTAPGASLIAATRLSDPRVATIVNPDPERGMWSSIHAGLAVAEGDPILVLPADMPFVSATTVRAVIDACAKAGRVVVPVHGGRRGHPVAFPGDLRAPLLAATSATLRDALASTGPRAEVPVNDAGVLRDVDVPSDLRQP